MTIVTEGTASQQGDNLIHEMQESDELLLECFQVT